MREIIQDTAKTNSNPELHDSKSMDFTKHDQKLEFILRNAACIFAEKNYHSTTMRDISRATGVSLAGLYHYCKSKEELLFLIQDNCFGRVLERLEQRLSEAEDPLTRLRIFIENHLSFFAANMAEMKVLSHEADSLAGELHTHVSTKKERYTTLARQILSELRPTQTNGSEMELTVATYALFGMMNWIYNWYDPAGKLKVSELVDKVTGLFLHGFLAGSSPGALDSPPKTIAEPMSVWRSAPSRTVK